MGKRKKIPLLIFATFFISFSSPVGHLGGPVQPHRASVVSIAVQGKEREELLLVQAVVEGRARQRARHPVVLLFPFHARYLYFPVQTCLLSFYVFVSHQLVNTTTISTTTIDIFIIVIVMDVIIIIVITGLLQIYTPARPLR